MKPCWGVGKKKISLGAKGCPNLRGGGEEDCEGKGGALLGREGTLTPGGRELRRREIQCEPQAGQKFAILI